MKHIYCKKHGLFRFILKMFASNKTRDTCHTDIKGNGAKDIER